jgi:hypothetical protein
MPRWLFATLLLIQTHFAASYLVPLDDTSRDAFGGLLRWAWPWEIGDSGLLGEITATSAPSVGFLVAISAGVILFMAVLAVFGYWVPFVWWKSLVIVGSVLSVILMIGFFDAAKVLPITLAAFLLWSTATDRVLADRVSAREVP